MNGTVRSDATPAKNGRWTIGTGGVVAQFYKPTVVSKSSRVPAVDCVVRVSPPRAWNAETPARASRRPAAPAANNALVACSAARSARQRRPRRSQQRRRCFDRARATLRARGRRLRKLVRRQDLPGPLHARRRPVGKIPCVRALPVLRRAGTDESGAWRTGHAAAERSTAATLAAAVRLLVRRGLEHSALCGRPVHRLRILPCRCLHRHRRAALACWHSDSGQAQGGVCALVRFGLESLALPASRVQAVWLLCRQGRRASVRGLVLGLQRLQPLSRPSVRGLRLRLPSGLLRDVV